MTKQMINEKNRFLIAFTLFVIFTAIIAISNYLASLAGGNEDSIEMMISGILFGFLAIPVFSIIIPLWLARIWNLPRSWIPQ